ncbi:MAG TPA: HIT family protein [Methylotenera sp.]|nr:HIT family protein [Methylotenera sp.]HPV44197.1 HIT family protein [Methylotenera sp.]
MQSCALCLPTPHEILWQDGFCRVVLLNDADYPAYCRVELIAHVKEMSDLPPPERERLMKTVFAVETAMREVLQPDKINLASLGNKTPHIHWHIVPRFSDDRHFPNSHWGEPARQSNIHALSGASKKLLQDKIKMHAECALSIS